MKFDLTPNPRLLTLGDVFLVAKLANNLETIGLYVQGICEARASLFLDHISVTLYSRERERVQDYTEASAPFVNIAGQIDICLRSTQVYIDLFWQLATKNK